MPLTTILKVKNIFFIGFLLVSIFGYSQITDFVTTWKTDNLGLTNNTSISFVLNDDGGNPISCEIDWENDGIWDQTYISNGRVTHNFGAAGIYTIRMRGTIPRIYHQTFLPHDAEKLISVEQWGTVGTTSFEESFDGCTNLTISALDNPNLSNVTSMKNMFRDCSKLNFGVRNNWATTNITDMGGLFVNCVLFNQNIGNWDLSNVTNISSMFLGATVFNQDISGWNTSSLTGIALASTFSGATNFNQNIGSWNVQNVTDTSFMFANTSAFNGNIGLWNTLSFEVTQHMFKNAIAFNQNISGWHMNNVYFATYMFDGATAFNQNIGTWNMGNLQNAYRMFAGATSFNGNINNWDLHSCTNMAEMFYGATAFNQNLNWNVSNVTKTTKMFRDATSFDGNLSSWNVSSLIDMQEMFRGAIVFNKPIGTWTTTSLTKISRAFQDATAFNQNINNWDITGVAFLSSVFSNAVNFNKPLNNWNTSNVTYMASLFYGATNFDQDLSSWNVQNLTTANFMFLNSGLSVNNYDQLLISWNTQSLQSNVSFGGYSDWCLGDIARTNIITTYHWTILDGSLNCVSCSDPTPTTWNGANWNNGVPNSNKPAIINANYDTTTNGSFTSCDCTINAGKTVNVRDGNFVNTNDLTNNGNLIIDNNGSFVQNSNTSTISGTGYYRMDRETTPYVEYDYTYWSSPTSVETIGDVFNTNSTLIAGATHPNAINDDDFSPATNIFWFDAQEFNDDDDDTFDDEGDVWQLASSALIMTPGRGYIAMGAGADFPFNTNFATGLKQNVFFEGEFNTGNIVTPVFEDNSTTDNWTNQNLIGNPYPSAIDINKLMTENLSVLQGTFYFWTHDSPLSGANPGPDAFNFTADDYAIATSDGSVFLSIRNGTASTAPKSYIASGQSVMATVLQNGNITFRNSMRNNTPNESFRSPENDGIDIVWLNLTNEEGIFRQQLIAFYKNGTNGYDDGLDGERRSNGNNYDFYSLMQNDNRRLAIQTQDNFNIDKVINLGIEIVETGTFTISIDHVDGIFSSDQFVYLQDFKTGEIHNLSESNYEFFIDATENLETRFNLRFTDNILSANEFNILNQVTIYPNPSNNVFNISWYNNAPISYKIVDYLGKTIVKKQEVFNQNKTQIDLSNFSKGVYFLELSTNDQKSVRKLILN